MSIKTLSTFTLMLVSTLLISACSNSGQTKGQEINDCLAKKSPEQCDREANGRRYGY